MKFLALLFVIGYASASFYDALDQASDEVVAGFLVGMELTPPLTEVIGLGYANNEELEKLESDIKTELGKTLKESLDEVLQKIRDSVEHGKEVSRQLVDKAKEIADKLKEIGQDAGGKTKELLEKIKEKAKDWLKQLLEKIGIGKRGLVMDFLEKLSLRNIVKKMKEKLSAINLDKVGEYIIKIFGEFSQTGKALLKSLRTRGREALDDIFQFLFPTPEYLDELEYADIDSELIEIETGVSGHVEKRWIVIAKAACMLIKHIGLGWGKNKLESWINNNVEPKWRSKLIKALKVGTPALKFLLGRFCYAAAPAQSDYAMVEVWQKIREFFKGLGLEIKEKFLRFGSWVRETVKEGVINIKDRVQMVKEIAKQVIENGKTMSKEAARQALEFLQPFKEDLGNLWENAKDTLKRVLGGEETY